MKRLWTVGMVLGMVFGSGVALAQMGPGMMGAGPPCWPGGPWGAGPGPGMMGGGGRFERPLISEMLSAKDRLGLTAEQEQKLRALRAGFEKEAIQRGAEIQAAEVDLRQGLEAATPDLGKVEAQAKRIAALQGDLRFARIKVLQEGRAVLTQEQWQKFEALTPRWGGYAQWGRGMGPAFRGGR
jgi:Spy/CpxP family protein refolding chaperone